MRLILKRIHFGDTFTVGQLYEETKYGLSAICYTLEDKVRQVEGQPVSSWKVQNETAIPTGTYPVSITFSNRFQTRLPLLSNVDGFTGIRIHSGNSSKNTEGCLLVGMTWDGKSDWIGSSKVAMSSLIPIIENSTSPVTIQIT
jgi:Family of unknown function (DUF5675)